MAKKVNPWAVCTAQVGREDKDKYERCVMKVKKQYNIKESLNETIVRIVEEEINKGTIVPKYGRLFRKTGTEKKFPITPSTPTSQPSSGHPQHAGEGGTKRTMRATKTERKKAADLAATTVKRRRGVKPPTGGREEYRAQNRDEAEVKPELPLNTPVTPKTSGPTRGISVNTSRGETRRERAKRIASQFRR